jgi:predicted transcriptional regulator
MNKSDSIKQKILLELDAMTSDEQQTILGIVENYLHSKADETEWNDLPDSWKKRIEESLQQADTGQFILHEDAMTYLRKKYNLNG